MIQFFKPKYPDKQTINLAIQETDKINVRNQLIAFILFLIGLALFVKFAVIGRLNAAEEAKRTYLETKQQIQMLEERTKEYSTLKELYSRLNDTFLSPSEAGEMDRMEIIGLVEDCVLDRADIESINITGNQVMIAVESTTLSAVSEIVAALEANEETAYVTVFTAGTGSLQKMDGTVSADIMVVLRSGGEK